MSGYFKAFGLLSLTVGSNYAGDLFSCDLKEMLTNNSIAKHTLGILLLFFFMVLTNPEEFTSGAKDGEYVTPKVLLKTLAIYILFVASTKMSKYYSLVIILMLVVFAFLDIEQKNKSPEVVAKMEAWKEKLWKGAILVTVVGCLQYFIKQYDDHEEFRIGKFLSSTKCTNGIKGTYT